MIGFVFWLVVAVVEEVDEVLEEVVEVGVELGVAVVFNVEIDCTLLVNSSQERIAKTTPIGTGVIQQRWT